MSNEINSELVTANRILFAQGVVDGFGHISVRDPSNPDRFFMSRSKVPGSVNAGDILLYGLDGEVIEPRGDTLYPERYIHSAIYSEHGDINSVVHSHSPAIIPFSVTPAALKPVCGVCGFPGSEVPVFEIRDVAGTGPGLVPCTGRQAGSVNAWPWQHCGRRFTGPFIRK